MSRTADILITNGILLTFQNGSFSFKRSDLAIKDGIIIDIGEDLSFKAKKKIEAKGNIVLPGLINAHTHIPMSLFRGIADDLPLETWWQKFIFPLEKKFGSVEFTRIGTQLSALEMIRSGTTTFCDMYFFEDEIAKVCKKIGIRCFLGEGILDFPTPSCQTKEETFFVIEDLNKKWGKDPLIDLLVAPHAPYTCGEKTLLASKDLAEKLGLKLHIHISETIGEVDQIRSKYNKTPVEYLDSIGFLDENVQAVHCVHLTENDIEILYKKKVKVIHCPESNMKLASGFSPVPEMQKKGIMLGLGTDGAASNNNLDMFDEMDFAAKIHKGRTGDTTVMDAFSIFKMATIDNADILGMKDKLGSLEIGKFADIIILNADRPHLIPLYNPCSHIVYSAGGQDVETVIIHGKLIMENRKILTIDEEKVLQEAREYSEKIKKEI
jgi:5-methylthioadenosine/S-adenosylhomocysteine deaminase